MEVSVLNRVLRVDRTEKVTEQLRGVEGVSHVDICGRMFWKGNSPRRGPEECMKVSVSMAEEG